MSIHQAVPFDGKLCWYYSIKEVIFLGTVIHNLAHLFHVTSYDGFLWVGTTCNQLHVWPDNTIQMRHNTKCSCFMCTTLYYISLVDTIPMSPKYVILIQVFVCLNSVYIQWSFIYSCSNLIQFISIFIYSRFGSIYI